MQIDSLVSDIYQLLQGKVISDPAVLEKFGPELGKVLTQRLLSRGEERVPTLRMSSIGRPLRQQWYDLKGFKGEELDGKTLLKFMYGDLIEALVLVLAEAAGHHVEMLQEEIEVDGVKGHIDAVIDGVLVDVKSCSPYSYGKFETGDLFTPGNDPFGYVGQLSGYAHALQRNEASFIAINKVLGSICTLPLRRVDLDGYDVRGRIAEVRRVVDSDAPPERCYEDEPDGKSGNRKLAVGCSYCGHRFRCWGDSNGGRGLQVYLYANGPRFLTSVAVEPKVFKANDKEETVG